MFEVFGQEVIRLGGETNKLFEAVMAGNDESRKISMAQIVATLNGQQIEVQKAQIEADKNATLKKIGNMILIGGGIWLFLKMMRKK